MYGTRDAALNWHECYSEHLFSKGFKRLRCNSCLFHHVEEDIRVLVHGDDYFAVGPIGDLEQLSQDLKNRFECKSNILAEGEGYDKEVLILNRRIRINENGILYECDPKHAQIIYNIFEKLV